MAEHCALCDGTALTHAPRAQRRWGVPSPDGDGSRIALDPRLALCDDEARGAWLLLHPQPSWQAVFALTYRGLVTAASRLRAVPRVQPGSYYLCDTRDDEEDIWQVARFRSFADFDRQVISTPKWLQLVRYAQLAWAEMGWRGCNNNVTDEIIARGWEDTAGLSNTSAREGVFSYITMEEMHLKDGALVHFYITWAKEQRPRQAGEVVVVPDAPRPPFFDTPGCAAHIEALCSPVPYDELPAGLFDEATLARLRLRRGVGEFCRRTRRGWRAVCEDEESGLDSGDLSEDSGSDSSEVTS